jgi:hypothetical protein
MTDISMVALSIAIGTLAAIVYALRRMVIMERKIDKLLKHQGISTREFES